MKSIRTRLLFAVLPVVALALFAAWAVATTTARHGLRELSDANLEVSAQGLADAVAQMLADARSDALTSARLDLAAEAIDTEDAKNFAWYADELVRGKKKYAAVVVTDVSGRVVAANTVDATGAPLKKPLTGSLASDPAFASVSAHPTADGITAFRGSPFLAPFELTKTSVVGFAVPIFDIVDDHIGSLFLFCSLDYFAERLASSLTTNGDAIDAVALIVDANDEPVVWPSQLGDRVGLRALDADTWVDASGTRYQAARHDLSGVGNAFAWHVTSLKTARALDAPVSSITYRIFVGSAMALVLALVVLVLATTRIVDPLLRLTSAIGSTARASAFTELPVSGADETSVLTSAINRMMTTIRVHEETLEQRVAERTAQLAAAKQELTDIFDNMKQGIFTVGASGTINAQYSAACRSIFGVDIAQRNVLELLQFAAPYNQGDSRMQFWMTNVVGADELQWTLAAEDPVPSVRYRGPDESEPRTYVDLQYIPIFKNAVVDKLMIIATDVTRLHDLETEVRARDEENRLTVERISEIVSIDPALFTTFLEEARQLVDDALAKVSGSDPQHAVREIFRAMHTLKGNARIFRITSLQNVAHAIEGDLDVLRAASGPIDLTAIRDQLTELAVLIGEFERLSRRVIGTQAVGGEAETRAATIKVQEAHVIAIRRAFKALRDRLGIADRDVLLELGASISTLGRIPFADTLQRYRREVADIARERGKPVNDLVVSGAAVELDARLSDKLGVILMHVLRNAVDHGLEPRDVRHALGKSSAGTISVTCTTSNGSVELVVSDDGRGIDYDRVREVAYTKGLLRDDELDAASPAQLIDLLYHPGFSTAREVTSISGRGVGLDVVRTAVADLRGTLDMASERGQGTTVRVVIPLADHEVL